MCGNEPPFRRSEEFSDFVTREKTSHGEITLFWRWDDVATALKREARVGARGERSRGSWVRSSWPEGEGVPEVGEGRKGREGSLRVLVQVLVGGYGELRPDSGFRVNGLEAVFGFQWSSSGLAEFPMKQP